MDTSSRTSVALATRAVRAARSASRRQPVSMAPDLEAMLARADAALIIGDIALFLDPHPTRAGDRTKIDLGELWTAIDRPAVRLRVLGRLAGRADARTTSRALQQARDEGVAHADEIAARVLSRTTPARQAVARALPAG